MVPRGTRDSARAENSSRVADLLLGDVWLLLLLAVAVVVALRRAIRAACRRGISPSCEEGGADQICEDDGLDVKALEVWLFLEVIDILLVSTGEGENAPPAFRREPEGPDNVVVLLLGVGGC